MTQPDMYGNLIKPGRSGILGLSVGVSLLGVPVVLVVILLMVRQMFLEALLITTVAIVAAALGAIVSPRDGRNVYQRTMVKLAHNAKVKGGNALYLAGPAGKTRDGHISLPGLMARSTVSDHIGAYDLPFGIIHVPTVGHYTIVLECHPDGDALVDQAAVNSMVSHWGAWLAELGRDGDALAASVTVESAPDTGLRLRQSVLGNIDPSSSAFSRSVARGIPDQVSAGAPSLTTRIALTFSGRGLDSKRADRGIEAMAAELGTRLPVLISTLANGTGAGTAVRACVKQDIIDFTRTAYDTTVAAQIEQARAQGGTGLTWGDAGPIYADDRQLDRYIHDRAVSKSWTMFEGPRGMFFSNSLRSLVAPTPGVLRKRVTMLYRPIPAGAAAKLAEDDINNARFAGSQKARASAHQQQRLRFAMKAAEEEAQGAGLVRFGMIVTVSCADASELPRLDKMIPSLSNQARLRVREALGNQAVYFQAALPLGVILPEHSLIPNNVKELL